MTQARSFRDLLNRERMVVAPGAYDCITAKLIEQAGFAAVYMTGAGTAATLGYPDFGLVTMSEMVANAGGVAPAVEPRGVDEIHIEDQEFPKKCGHLEGKQIIPREEWLAKIRAAAAARRDRDFMIIARTQARAGARAD